MKYLLSKVSSSLKSAYRSAVRFTARTRRQLINYGNAIYNKVKGVIITYINDKYILTRINKTQRIVEQAQSQLPPPSPPARFQQPVDNEFEGPIRFESTGFYENPQVSNASNIPDVKSEAPNEDQGLDTYDDFFLVLEWKPIQMSIKQFKNIRKLTQKSFQSQVKNLICPVRKEVMRQPCSMKCCRKHLQKSDRYAQKKVLIREINMRRRCVLCQKPAFRSYVHFEQKMDTFVTGLRQKIMATYYNLDQEQKGIWKVLIDENFGAGYTEKHLENMKLIQ